MIIGSIWSYFYFITNHKRNNFLEHYPSLLQEAPLIPNKCIYKVNNTFELDHGAGDRCCKSNKSNVWVFDYGCVIDIIVFIDSSLSIF